MNYELMYPSRFLKSAEFQGRDVTLTIASVKLEKLEGDGGKKTKGIITFRETEREWLLNRTNGEALKLMWGVETDGWIGKRVTLYPAKMQDPFGAGEITAIRVRGSPDLDKAKSATVQRGRKTLHVAVQPTGQGARAKPGPKPKAEPTPAAPPPESEDEPGMSASDRREAREKANGGRGTVEEQLADGKLVAIEDATGGDPFGEPGARG